MAKTYLEPFQQFFERLENAGELRNGISAETAARYCLSTISPLFQGKVALRKSKRLQNKSMN